MINTQQVLKYLFNNKIHVSWLITALCLGFISGIALSLFPQVSSFSDLTFVIVGVALFSLALMSRARFMILVALVAGLILGLWRGAVDQVDLNIYKSWIGQEVIIEGVISSDPNLEIDGMIRLDLKSPKIISVSDYEQIKSQVANIEDYLQDLPGHIWVSARSQDQIVKRSDLIRFRGNLKPGFGSFPASMHQAILISDTKLSGADPMRDVRDYFAKSLSSVIDEPEASLGMGILAGQKTALPSGLSEAFIIASLTHIVVASGYNLTILVRSSRRLFARISRFAALSFSGLMIVTFAYVTGFSPSMNRAVLVTGLSLLAWYYGRRFHPVTLLSLVAALTVLAEPSNVWGNVSWYLSFLSFVGVIILAPLINDYFFGDYRKQIEDPNLLFNLRRIFIETVSAQIMAAPVIALVMGQFSVYGLIANLLVLPILPLTMLMTFIAGIGSMILPNFIANILSQPAEWLLKYIIEVANYISNLPGSSTEISISAFGCVVIFIVVSFLVFYMKFKTKHNFREDDVIE